MDPQVRTSPYIDLSPQCALPSRARTPSATRKTPATSKKAPATKRIPILIVEDEFLVGIEAEAALNEAGFEVVGIAASAENAIAMAASLRPSVVVMDIRLAGERDGVDAALELFRDYGIRCLFATAHQDETVRKRASPALPLGWLNKPYTGASLVKSVRQAALDVTRKTH